MSDIWLAAELWPVRVAVIGGGVLLAGRLLMAFTAQPPRRALVGTLAVVLALAVIPLCLLPGWVPLTVHAGAAAPVVATGPPPDTQSAQPSDRVQPANGDDGAFAFAPDPAELPPSVPMAAHEPTVREAPATLTAAPAASASRSSWSIDGREVAFAAYGLIVGMFLIRLLVGQIGLNRLWRAARPAPMWAEGVFRELADKLCPRARLRVSHPAGGPVCFGVWRPRVLIPVTAVIAGDGPALRSILTHELGHLRRGDPLVGWLLGLVRAVYFVWPWLVGLRREVRLAQEHLADADAARMAGPAEYAELLIRMTRARPAPLGAAGVRGPSSELYRRVTMVLRTSGRVEGRCPRRWALAAGGALTALAVAAAGLYVQPRPAVAAEPDKKEADKSAPKPEDLLKDALDKLKKDLGDNPEAVKQLDELMRGLKDGKPAAPLPGVAGPPPLPVPPPAPALRGAPIQPGRIDRPDLDREIEQAREMMRRYMEQMQAQLRAGGLQGGAFVGPPGALRPLGLTGGGRLGVRVEKPSDVLASQLELPNGQGLVCIDVPADSPAGKAGIKPNDILLEVAGKAVPSDRDEFVKALKEVKPDAPVDVIVLRKGKKETLKGVRFPEAKEPEFPGFPGAGLRDFQGPGVIVAPVPFPAFDPPALPSAGKNAGVILGPGETVRVEQVNDAFTVFYSKNGVKVTISGSKDADGQAKAESIEVEADGKTTKAESIEKLPKEYQDMAKAALKSIK